MKIKSNCPILGTKRSVNLNYNFQIKNFGSDCTCRKLIQKPSYYNGSAPTQKNPTNKAKALNPSLIITDGI